MCTIRFLFICYVDLKKNVKFGWLEAEISGGEERTTILNVPNQVFVPRWLIPSTPIFAVPARVWLAVRINCTQIVKVIGLLQQYIKSKLIKL